MRQGSIQVWYQPVLCSRSLKVTSFEALLRWRHDQHGWISPEEVILTTAAMGRSQDLLSFILNDVASLLQAVSSHDDVKMGVNVSPRELAHLDIHSLVVACFGSHTVSPSRLELEITEDVALNHALVKERLARLTDLGVRLAIDDFGTGYSSLASLQHLHVDRVKIDRSFVTGTTLNSSNSSLVDALIRVSQAYGFDVVAEGVETLSDLETMRSLGCHYVQGYYFSKAMPRSEAIEWIKKANASTH